MNFHQVKKADVSGTSVAPKSPDPEPGKIPATPGYPSQVKKSFDTRAYLYEDGTPDPVRSGEHWALDGRYPLDTPQHLKMAEEYFHQHFDAFSTEERRQFAVSLVKRAAELSVPLGEKVASYGSPVYASGGVIDASIRMRHAAIPAENKEAHALLDKVAQVQPMCPPDVAIEMLRQLDVKYALDRNYGDTLLDPVQSLVGTPKTAAYAEVLGTIRVTDVSLKNLATNHRELLLKYLSEDATKAFQNNPVGAFKAMPAHLRTIVSRLCRSTEPGVTP